jgi:MoaA/NifB/PqqE/SkfB family radical SAM enzyme
MPDELNTIEKLFLLKQLQFHGCTHLVIAGGEPLSSPDAVDFIQQAHARGVKITLQTNGAFRQRLTEVVHLLDWLALPLDAVSGKNQILLRTTNQQLKWTTEAAQILRASQSTNCKLKIGTVVTPHNIGELPAMIKTVQNLKPNIWKWYQVRPRGEGKVNFDSLFLDQSEIEAARDEISQLLPEIGIVTSMITESRSSYLIVDPNSDALIPEISSYKNFGRLVQTIEGKQFFNESVWSKFASSLDEVGQRTNMQKTFPNWI